MGRLKSAFSFYGGKGRIAHRYPAPRHRMIIEPFAGAAGYSMYWAEPDRRLRGGGPGHQVTLSDIDPITVGMWQWLKSREALEYIPRVPETITAGTLISERFVGWPAPMIHLLQAEANQGTQGARGVHDQVTTMGAKCWPRVRRKLEWARSKCVYWTILQEPYYALPNVEATWFIDPPYQGDAGRRYRCGSQNIDFAHLAQWALARRGQVIVAEGAGASWLPFRPLMDRAGIKSRYQVSSRKELMWTND